MAYADDLLEYMTPDRQTIWLKGNRQHYDEDPCSEAVKPGHLLDVFDSTGTRKVRKQTATTKQPLCIAIEDSLQGLTVDDAYTSGDIVRYIVAKPGDEFQVRLPAAAAAIVKGDLLECNGAGLFKILAAATPLVMATESVDNSAGGTEVFIDVMAI